jgi:type IV secretory pathway component VirB8
MADEPDDEERLRRQRARSIMIAASLLALVAVFYIATMVRLGGNVFNRAI